MKMTSINLLLVKRTFYDSKNITQIKLNSTFIFLYFIFNSLIFFEVFFFRIFIAYHFWPINNDILYLKTRRKITFLTPFLVSDNVKEIFILIFFNFIQKELIKLTEIREMKLMISLFLLVVRFNGFSKTQNTDYLL